MNHPGTLLLYMVSTHLLAEYAGPWRTVRDDLKWRDYFWRGALFLSLSSAWLIPWLSWKAALGILLLTISREVVRWLLARNQKALLAQPLAAPFLELGIHLALLLVWLWIHQACSTSEPVRLGGWASYLTNPSAWKSIAFVTGLIFAIGGGTVFVRGLLAQAGRSPSEDDSTKSPSPEEYGVGRIIGDLERALIFLMALERQLDAAGLVLAAKSLARFKEFEDQEFAEYYLLGTLSSTLWAILVAKILLLVTRLDQ